MSNAGASGGAAGTVLGMQVVHVASEVFPFSRSGGLGDVLGVLPAVQAGLGAEVTVVSAHR